jgi:hypothetical protein
MKVIGICLVRNDDRFLEQVIANIHDFCDAIILADHQSRDGTSEICRLWAEASPKVHYHRIQHPSESHELIRPYSGSNTWVFGVDGDELYEPERLSRLRQQLMEGRFRDVWQVLGKVLHCDDYAAPEARVKGYLARPSRSMTKLYNFSLIDDWEGPCSERLHHGRIRFKDVVGESGRKDESESELPWEEAVFRCLHMVFVRRSSLQSETDTARPNIAERNSFSVMQRCIDGALRLFGREPRSRTKHLTYCRGPRVELDASCFFDATHIKAVATTPIMTACDPSPRKTETPI